MESKDKSPCSSLSLGWEPSPRENSAPSSFFLRHVPVLVRQGQLQGVGGEVCLPSQMGVSEA